MIDLPIRTDDVARIAGLDDPVLRNLWITQAYADLSQRMQAVVGHSDLTWCGFGVWASATAGLSIRGEELPSIITEIMNRGIHHQRSIKRVNRCLGPFRAVGMVKRCEHHHVQRAFDEAIAAVAQHIAHGNTIVFQELAPRFIAFLERCERQMARTPDGIGLDDVAGPTAGAVLDSGLPEAFRWYAVAANDSDDEAKAQAVLAANVLAVAHEQERLQPDIAAALDVGLLTAEHLAAQLVGPRAPRWAVRVLSALARGPIEQLLRAVWDDAATELLMTLRVPGAVLHLARDLPDLVDGELFPPALRSLSEAGVAAVYERWDRTGGTGQHAGARDWARLELRMSFIVNLFRSRQQEAELASSPFDPGQLDDLRSGRVPAPPLVPGLDAALR